MNDSLEKKIAIFGAGNFGKLAYNQYKDLVRCFVDNNENLVGTELEGIPIISALELAKKKNEYEIVVAVKHAEEIVRQLKDLGITEYLVYQNDERAYFPGNELIYNPYKETGYLQQSDEAISMRIREIDSMVEDLYQKQKLFDHVEIETVNRCNGACDFCPVSVGHDSREYKMMTEDLFKKIIDELSEIDYTGKLALFSNNEPFLDPDILERHRYARERLPKARLHLFTNGTLLTVDKFIELMKYLDELIIDNYRQDLNLIRPCREIVEYCEQHQELKNKVTIVLRKPHEVLSSRGGDAPNKEVVIKYPKAKCVLPFKQLIIRPDGKVSLCCNDPLGRNTLGDVSQDSLVDVWNNARFQMVRKCLREGGRSEWKHCECCDSFTLG